MARVKTGSCCIRTDDFNDATDTAAARRPMKADREMEALCDRMEKAGNAHWRVELISSGAHQCV